MLWDIEKDKEITNQPHPDTWRHTKKLSSSEFDGIVEEINRLIDGAKSNEVATAGWLPGNDWSDTPFQCIYTKAADSDYDTSAKLFGLFVWHTLQKRQGEYWAFGRYSVGEREIRSMTYFRVYPDN